VRGCHQDAPQDSYLFATAAGGRLSEDNFRSRVLGKPATVKDGKRVAGKGAIVRANEQLEAAGLPPLPAELTPHSFAPHVLLAALRLRRGSGRVMDEMGHTDPALALRVYRQSMRRSDAEKAALRALVDGAEWANAGERADETTLEVTDAKAS
jgi:integrase